MKQSSEAVVTMSVVHVLYTIVIGAMLLFAVLSNCLVVYCVVRFKKLRTVTNVFICNLSISDILLAGCILPMKIHDIFHEEDFFEGLYINRLYMGNPETGTFTNSEDPDEMPHHAAFYLGLHCL